jgi:hypothetical protein
MDSGILGAENEFSAFLIKSTLGFIEGIRSRSRSRIRSRSRSGEGHPPTR